MLNRYNSHGAMSGSMIYAFHSPVANNRILTHGLIKNKVYAGYDITVISVYLQITIYMS